MTNVIAALESLTGQSSGIIAVAFCGAADLVSVAQEEIVRNFDLQTRQGRLPAPQWAVADRDASLPSTQLEANEVQCRFGRG